MSDSTTQTYSVAYGLGQIVEFTANVDQVVWQHYAPTAVNDLRATIRESLEAPIDFPALSQAVIPDDRIAIAAEADTPGLSVIISEIWSILSEQGIQAEHITIVQAPGSEDPRGDLPDDVREKVGWQLHTPDDKNSLSYLASTTGGDRVKLARTLTDAEVVLSVGRIGFDPVLGYRGTNSAFYPALSDADAVVRARGQGHSELQPDDSRPLRQMVDEVGWLLGTQFTIQTTPASNGGVSSVMAGAFEPVLRRGKEFVSRELLVTPDERPELVVVSVTNDAGGHGWNQIGAAIATAGRIVARDGKILVLSDVNEPCGQGMEMLRQVESAADAIKPLRLETPLDLIPATQIATTVQRASVYLLSKLSGNLADELFMFSLSEPTEAVRLIEQTEGTVAIIEDAHNVHARIAE